MGSFFGKGGRIAEPKEPNMVEILKMYSFATDLLNEPVAQPGQSTALIRANFVRNLFSRIRLNSKKGRGPQFKSVQAHLLF